jgi:lactoylglutathione lyase
MIRFTHFNFNVLDLERSLKFYDEALGLKPVREIVPEDGSFKIVYLSDGKSDFTLELTWLRDRTEPYNLGDEEFHLAFETDDYEGVHARHAEMGIICFENPEMGIYFVKDPDGYWVEILPTRG